MNAEGPTMPVSQTGIRHDWLTREQAAFLTLLRNHVHGTSPELFPNVGSALDWEVLYKIASAQSLTGVCYAELKRLTEAGAEIPKEALTRFREDFHMEVYHAVNRQAVMEEIAKIFSKENIPFLPFKGWIVKEAWPEPFLRRMGDIDLLIRLKDRKQSDQILLDMGFRKYVDNHAVWTYREKDAMLEVHDHMFYETLTGAFDYRGYFDKAVSVEGGHLSAEVQYLYLIAHMAKHILNSGIGFRAFLDLVFYGRKEELDWTFLEKELEKMALLSFAKTCFSLCREWFGWIAPLECGELEEDFLREATWKVFSDGTFGLTNPQNETARTASAMQRSFRSVPKESSAWECSRRERRGQKNSRENTASYWITAFKLTWKKLFPPYEDLQLIPWYSFVDGRPYLLPVAWVYRWGYCLAHKREHGMTLLAEPFVRRGEVEAREAFLRTFGLP